MNQDNQVWNTINRIALDARPKQKYRLGLGDWDAATPAQRAAMDLWCAAQGYELVIDLTDLGRLNDHVRDMETRDMDVLENGREDYSIWPRQAGGAV